MGQESPSSTLPATAWLEALPYASALLETANGQLRLLRVNQRFAPHVPAWKEAVGTTGLRNACEAVLEGRQVECRYPWDQSGFGVGPLELIIRRLPASSLALLSLVKHSAGPREDGGTRHNYLADSMTGLPNRAGFEELLERRLAIPPGNGHALTLLLIDIRGFNRINESIGALGGDELLLAVARRLRRQTRASDILARVGADMFALLSATQPDQRGAEMLATRIRAVFDTPFRIGTALLPVEAAIAGIAALAHRPGHSEPDAPELLRQAQAALQHAKRGNLIAFYEPVALAQMNQRLNRETALRAAVARGAITLAFQPLVEMRARRIIGFEALARWEHDGTPVPPAEFVPIAEESGLIVPLGRLVARRAIATLAEWDRRFGSPVPLHISINVSPLQLAHDDMVKVLQDALENAGIDGSRLIVEITESCLIENPAAAEQVLRALVALDIRVAMDDFGTGYSNIARLQGLPIDTLKIDRSLIAGIDSSNDSLAIVRTIQRLAEALGFRTTAEGIESETVAQQIAAIGCDTGQGFLFSPPLDADAAYAIWKRGRSR